MLNNYFYNRSTLFNLIIDKTFVICLIMFSFSCTQEDKEIVEKQSPPQENLSKLHHAFSSLKDALIHPENVYALTISDTKLTILPKELLKFKNLKVLTIYKAPIRIWPDYLCELKLEKLELYEVLIPSKDLTEIEKKMPDTDVEFLKRQMECASIWNCNIDSNKGWYKLEINSLKEWEKLIKLDSTKQASIYELDFGQQFDQLPNQLRNFSELRAIKFLNSGLKKLPASIGELSHLRVLYIDKCKLSYLPIEIGNVKNLCEFRSFQNPLSKLPESFGQISRLRVAELSNNNFTKFPLCITHLKKLENLDLSINNLEEVPKEIKNLRRLKTLNISSNQIHSLPDELGDLQGLENLLIDNNKFHTFPKCICKLLKLETLYLGYFENLPKEFANLKNLRTLSVSGLTEFPIALTNLDELTNLEIHGASFSSIPESVKNMKGLKEVIFHSCKLSEFNKTYLKKLLPLVKFEFR